MSADDIVETDTSDQGQACRQRGERTVCEDGREDAQEASGETEEEREEE